MDSTEAKKTGPKGPWKLTSEQRGTLRREFKAFVLEKAKELGCGENTIRRELIRKWSSEASPSMHTE